MELPGGALVNFDFAMPENRAHAATGGRIAVNSERNRKTVESNGDRKAVSRLLIIACLAVFWLSTVFGRLGYLQLFRHSEYMARAQRQQQRVIEITPKRGAIYDRNMHPLAMSIPWIRRSRCLPSLATSNWRRGCCPAFWEFQVTCSKRVLSPRTRLYGLRASCPR